MRDLLSVLLLITVFLHHYPLSTALHVITLNDNFHYWPYLGRQSYYGQQFYPVELDEAHHDLRSATSKQGDAAIVVNANPTLFGSTARLLGMSGFQSGIANVLASLRPVYSLTRTVTATTIATTVSASTVYCASSTHFEVPSPPTCPVTAIRDKRAIIENDSDAEVAPSTTFQVQPTKLPAGLDEKRDDSTLPNDKGLFDVESSIADSAMPSEKSESLRNTRHLFGRFLFSLNEITETVMALVSASATVTAAVDLGTNLTCIPPGYVIC